MASFQAPPTYAQLILFDDKSQDVKSMLRSAKFNPIWLKWFIDLIGVINTSGGGGGTIQHNSLAGLQGGGGTEFYHFTASEHTILTAMAGVAVNGILCRTAANIYAARTITGTAQQIAVTNGDGVAGNPTLSFVQDTGWTAQTAVASKGDLGASPTVAALASWAAAIQNMLATKGITNA